MKHERWASLHRWRGIRYPPKRESVGYSEMDTEAMVGIALTLLGGKVPNHTPSVKSAGEEETKQCHE